MLKRHLLLFIGLLSIFFLSSHPASAQSCNISWFTITPATGITPDTNLYIEVGGGCSNGVRAIRLSYNGQVFSELGSAAMSAYYTYQSDGELCAEIAAYGDDNWSNPGRRCQWISGSGQQQPQQPSQQSQPSQPQQPTGDVNAPGLDDWQRAQVCRQLYGDQSYPSRRNNQWFCVGGSAAPQQPQQPSQPSQPAQPQQPTGDVNAPGLDDWQRAQVCRQAYGDNSYPTRSGNQWRCVGGSAPQQPSQANQPQQPSQPSQPSQPQVQPLPQRGSGAACYAPEPVGVGSRARVRFGGVANRVRSNPNLGATQIASINPGSEFDVIGDSVCADGYRWWQINFNGTVGWTADGDDRDYWIENLSYSPPEMPIQESVVKSTDWQYEMGGTNAPPLQYGMATEFQPQGNGRFEIRKITLNFELLSPRFPRTCAARARLYILDSSGQQVFSQSFAVEYSNRILGRERFDVNPMISVPSGSVVNAFILWRCDLTLDLIASWISDEINQPALGLDEIATAQISVP